MSILHFTILGCGSSGGVPRVGGLWGDCDPENPKNRRSRCSLLVELISNSRTTRVLIDTSPDLREQLLSAGVGTLDGVVFTHPHADHVNGLDDLRVVYINQRKRVPVWANKFTSDALLSRFNYAFIQPEGSPYPPILELNRLQGPIRVDGEAGSIEFVPFAVEHGNITSYGFKIGPLVYLPDISEMNDEAWSFVRDIPCWIVDALRREPHPSHSHLSRTLEWIAKASPRRAILTNMHIDLDYETIANETPGNVEPAYDGLTISFEV